MRTIRFLALAAIFAPIGATAQQAGADEAARTISADDYAWRVGVIAHDSMGGRDTPSEGLDKTAEWAASEFRRMGLRGGAEGGSFIQRYPLSSVMVDAAASGLSSGGVSLGYGTDLLPLRSGPVSGSASADLVLVSGSTGMGGLGAADIEGKHAIIVRAQRTTRLDRSIFQLVLSVAGAGALSVSVTSSADDAAWAADARRALAGAVAQGAADPTAQPAGDFLPMLQIRTASLERLLAGRGVDLAALQARAGNAVRAHPVDGPAVTLSQVVRLDDITAPNVVAILEGSDPVLRDEHVVFSGHIDHVGMGTPDQNGDSIFNGADDDASGTVAVIEIAEAMASLPTAPRRSMIFLLVSGEEKGLWGSEWYADHPSVPVEQLVADFNTDMVGRNWPDTIVAIGKEHSDLGETLDRVNADHPELRMTAIDDLWPEENFYGRSDHFNFARKGVPILFFFNGTHEDYHGLDDEPDRIDSEKAARIAKLVFYLGLEVANADERPKWNPESYARIVSDR